mmetsp:Transcript_5740/g.6380  ORF Transcript_5740/g.6380 Transcript_5740/m.6380 type:complete len:409 (+) Transcript_5740:213-1439(+)|eukprot:CAMPEP_0115042196 /NCGR_PEP_ID=MMETSP0216-20121206/46129_1 /TAXON_ID=223996 /ORGANISM="Protocruzia adherens, Strain Boccale" /LENGTH=408 /DNA_ID=CAMNT_0002424279 /DNA_START=187 /DNA_END=1413 /DNA_ORIENTATION=+
MDKRRVAYFYDPDVGTFYYGQQHPMKPHRIRMAHQLILNYGLYRKMEVYRPHYATDGEMAAFHSPEYIKFLKNLTPITTRESLTDAHSKFNVGESTDCPIFEGLYQFGQISAGGSIDAAIKLNQQTADICINWAGGLHHAKKSEASGFCYINDIVLAILELLKYHARVLYIDIDVHHGDGVEEAFYITNRVMTVSFHRFGDFFPGTGDLKDTGAGPGKKYSINVPLKEGIDDQNFVNLFKSVITDVIQTFKPGVIVLQCGADSVAGDRLGTFNLTLRGHAECLKITKSFGIPMLVLGGGGYTVSNVARCWTYETAMCLDEQNNIEDKLPSNDFYECYGPDYNLHVTPQPNLHNQNSKEYMDKILVECLQNVKSLEGAPSVQIQDVPPDFFPQDDTDDNMKHFVKKRGQ